MSKKNAMGYIFPQVIRSVLRGETPKTSISMYVEKEAENLKPGDTWEDADGREWYINEHGTKVRKSILQSARMPWWCPKCEMIMNKHQDEKFYWSQGMCMNCVTRRDTDMKIDGTWEAYEKKVISDKVTGFLKDAKKEIVKYLESLSDTQTFVGEDGELEEWTGDVTQLREFLENEIVEIDKSLKKYESEENHDEFH